MPSRRPGPATTISVASNRSATQGGGTPVAVAFMATSRDGHYEAARERLVPNDNRLATRIGARLACPGYLRIVRTFVDL
jgi:hypothetical protein